MQSLLCDSLLNRPQYASCSPARPIVPFRLLVSLLLISRHTIYSTVRAGTLTMVSSVCEVGSLLLLSRKAYEKLTAPMAPVLHNYWSTGAIIISTVPASSNYYRPHFEVLYYGTFLAQPITKSFYKNLV